jgi:hypothetical protein
MLNKCPGNSVCEKLEEQITTKQNKKQTHLTHLQTMSYKGQLQRHIKEAVFILGPKPNSTGLKNFLVASLQDMAVLNPDVNIRVLERDVDPAIMIKYGPGNSKMVQLQNMSETEVEAKFKEMVFRGGGGASA